MSAVGCLLHVLLHVLVHADFSLGGSTLLLSTRRPISPSAIRHSMRALRGPGRPAPPLPQRFPVPSRHQAAGYRVTDAADWLGLTPQERTLVNMRVSLALEVERLRKESHLTQKALAAKIGAKQSGVARMLGSLASATIDSLIKTLLALGATPRRIAALI